MKTKTRRLIGICFLLLLPCLAEGEKNEAVQYRVGLTSIISAPPVIEAARGFIDQLEEMGFDGTNTRVYQDFAEGDMGLSVSILQNYVHRKVDLIAAVTTPSAQSAVSVAKGTGIPVVFMAVTAPVEAGLVNSWKNPGGNVTGVSDRMDVYQQIMLIKEIVPSLEKLGTVYNSGEVNSLVQIEDLRNVAQKLELKILEAAVSAGPELRPATLSLVGKVDAVWLPTDNVISIGLESVSTVCITHKIPLFGADVNQVSRGEIAALGIKNYEHGKDAGKKAAAILSGEKKAHQIPVTGSKMNLLWVYPRIAEKVGITLSPQILERADKIIKD